MTLGGLHETVTGLLVFSSCVSIMVSTIGLLLLRVARPTDQDPNDSWLRGMMFKGGATMGAFLYFLGLVLASMPFLVGSSGTEGRESAIIQCTLVLCLAAADFAWNSNFNLYESILCVMVWLSTTMIEWVGPRAYDNMTTGLASQIGGCDGGFRCSFVIYVAIWLTCIIFGSALMVCEDSPLANACSDKDEDELPLSWRSNRSNPSSSAGSSGTEGSLRRRALPFIFGFSTSMSGLAFAVGAASDQLGFVFFGSMLLILAVLCAWDWLWRLELSLVMWGALTQALHTLGSTCQTHLAFRDLRWDAAGSNMGLLEIERSVGLPLFVLSFMLLIVTILLLVHQLTRQDQSDEDMKALENEEEEEDDEEEESPCGPFRFVLELVILGATIGCFIPGILLPLYSSVNHFPKLMLDGKAQGGGGGPTVHDAPNMLHCINMAYTNELPCTALVSIFQFLVIPPLQFVGNLMLIWRPPFLPRDVYRPLQTEIANQAPYRFMNPLMVATTLAISHFSWNAMLAEIGVPPNNEVMDNRFGGGAYCMLGYGVFSIILAQLLSCDTFPTVGPQPELSVQLQDEENESDDDDAYSVDSVFAAVAVSLFVLPLVCVAGYCALTTPFITFQIRVSGIILKVVHPTLIELYHTLAFENPILGWLAIVTFLVTLVVWATFFLLRIPYAWGVEMDCLDFCNFNYVSKRAEQLARPWVMTHLWALCFFLIFYILLGKNKAIQELCVRPPPSVLGLLGLAILYFGMLVLLGNASRINPDAAALRDRTKPNRNLPGGEAAWKTAVVTSIVFWVVLFFYMGPVHRTLVTDYRDVNNKLEGMVPMLDHKLNKRIPHSSGDCAARWQEKHPGLPYQGDFAAHEDCHGHHPITTMAKGPVNVTARWIEGMNSIRFSEVSIHQPKNNVGPQNWDLTLAGEFTDLHIWLDVTAPVQTSGYMCCSNPFRFSLRASALCTEEHGFYSPVKLEVDHLDDFVWKNHADWDDAMGSHISLNIDYGAKATVQNTVRNTFVNELGLFKVQMTDGTLLDPLGLAANVLQAVVQQNSGSRCPRMPNLPQPAEPSEKEL